jgi:hypothetical protein
MGGCPVSRPATFGALMADLVAKRGSVPRATWGREPIQKAGTETFGQAIAAGEVDQYFAAGMAALADVIWSALHPGTEPPALTPQDRIDAVSNSVEEFRVGLVERMAAAVTTDVAAIAGDATATAPVAKARWRGVL